MMREIPILFEEEAECCGCGACQAVCIIDAISMRYSRKGFYYPWIDSKKCVGCRRCIVVCPLK